MGWSDTRVLRRCAKCLGDKPTTGGMMVGARRGRGGMAVASFVCFDCVCAHVLKHGKRYPRIEIKLARIEDTFYGPANHHGELMIEKTPGHDRVVRSLAKCPWHDEKTASLTADHYKGTFHCFGCGLDGYLVTGPMDKPGYLTLQREYDA